MRTRYNIFPINFEQIMTAMIYMNLLDHCWIGGKVASLQLELTQEQLLLLKLRAPFTYSIWTPKDEQ
jgi:hypothetical protein